MYIYIEENKVRDIIPDRDERFPNVPIENRYAPEYLEKCVYAPDDTDVKIGMIYDPEDGSFGYPPVDDDLILVEPEYPSEPENVLTQDDYNMDFDYRLSCLELGL